MSFTADQEYIVPIVETVEIIPQEQEEKLEEQVTIVEYQSEEEPLTPLEPNSIDQLPFSEPTPTYPTPHDESFDDEEEERNDATEMEETIINGHSITNEEEVVDNEHFPEENELMIEEETSVEKTAVMEENEESEEEETLVETFNQLDEESETAIEAQDEEEDETIIPIVEEMEQVETMEEAEGEKTLEEREQSSDDLSERLSVEEIEDLEDSQSEVAPEDVEEENELKKNPITALSSNQKESLTRWFYKHIQLDEDDEEEEETEEPVLNRTHLKSHLQQLSNDISDKMEYDLYEIQEKDVNKSMKILGCEKVITKSAWVHSEGKFEKSFIPEYF